MKPAYLDKIKFQREVYGLVQENLKLIISVSRGFRCIISEQGFRCIISVTRGSDASFRLAQVQMFNINE